MIAPAHMGQGSFVTYKLHSERRQSLSVFVAEEIAMISA